MHLVEIPFSRSVYCSHCRVNFLLALEPYPQWPIETIAADFPHALDFLKDIRYCPVCKSPLEGKP